MVGPDKPAIPGQLVSSFQQACAVACRAHHPDKWCTRMTDSEEHVHVHVCTMYMYSSSFSSMLFMVVHSCVCALLCVCTDFGGSGEEVEVVEVQEYVGDPAYGTATTQLHKVDIHVQTLVLYMVLSQCQFN